MSIRLTLAGCLVGASVLVAQAQGLANDVAPARPDPYAHDKYITGTGATVANPGVSQSGGTTAQDRAIQREDNKIDSGICKGC